MMPVMFETKRRTKECELKRLEEPKGVGRSSASFRALPCSDLEEKNTLSLRVHYFDRTALTLMYPGGRWSKERNKMTEMFVNGRLTSRS